MKKLRKSKSLILKIVSALMLACSLIAVCEVTNHNPSTQTVQAAKLSKRERNAKNWIAQRESGGNYHARNGACYGKFQLNIGYLHGDYSKKNQNKTADRYVKNRYGSWVNAKKFWQSHHWY
ncbi:aggregation promoting factor surface protein [Lactobacillus sp. ESL0681]|uniref:aggregation-promoting factor C-terminal-like domain-containing protein n=1 Tax=Lactobacillus sp. ESL0681 TaxID=2983211 RepID=UPI0023F758AC|nr:aggregation promoting factor surface protein [Lactobacillus sp. ESL0681]WEV39937.1 aggregation promoting factor surface protein [Lactobacillus sp. ESL0681]